MAQTTLTGKLQMIDEKGIFRSSQTQEFVKKLEVHLPKSSHCTVISIIGPQNSGKSYLLNALFGTQFAVLSRGRRKKVTKGIWTATGSINPSIIVIDVEGSDGRERGEDGRLFERQSALFALTVSDVLLLNMLFTDIGRLNGAGHGLIKLIFKERVKIDAPNKRTKVIIVVRDHDYKQSSPDDTKEDLETTMNKLWKEVHPDDMDISDYIEVIVKDFPSYVLVEEFTQKTKDLAKFLNSLAGSGSIEHNNYASGFAFSSERIWNLICKNERIVAADEKLAMSFYMCTNIISEKINSLHKVEGYEHLISGTSCVKEFNAELMLFLERIKSRYEEETRPFHVQTRNEMMKNMEKIIVEKFKPTFKNCIASLCEEMRSGALSNLPQMLNKLPEFETSAVNEVLQDNYFSKLDEVSLSDLHPEYKGIFEEHRQELENDLRRMAGGLAKEIQLERSVQGCNQIITTIMKSLDQEEGCEYLKSDMTITVMKFNAELKLFLKRILSRFAEQTRAFDRTVREEKMVQLEKTMAKKFEDSYKKRLANLRQKMISEAESNLGGQLDKLHKLDEAAAVKVLHDNYVNVFDEMALADFHPDNLNAFRSVRGMLGCKLQKILEREIKDIQRKRNIKKGLKITAKVILGTAGVVAVGAAGTVMSAGVLSLHISMTSTVAIKTAVTATSAVAGQAVMRPVAVLLHKIL